VEEKLQDSMLNELVQDGFCALTLIEVPTIVIIVVAATAMAMIIESSLDPLFDFLFII
jgi:hypothetical protein